MRQQPPQTSSEQPIQDGVDDFLQGVLAWRTEALVSVEGAEQDRFEDISFFIGQGGIATVLPPLCQRYFQPFQEPKPPLSRIIRVWQENPPAAAGSTLSELAFGSFRLRSIHGLHSVYGIVPSRVPKPLHFRRRRTDNTKRRRWGNPVS